MDYEDFLRQRKLPQWKRSDPRRNHLIAQRPKTADDVARWVKEQSRGLRGQSRLRGQNSVSTLSTKSTTSTVFQEFSANAALTLIDVDIELLTRQLKSQAAAFMSHGGFTERLYNFRSTARRRI